MYFEFHYLEIFLLQCLFSEQETLYNREFLWLLKRKKRSTLMGPCNTWKNGMDIERTDTFESQKDYKGTYGLIYDHTLFGFTLLWLNTTNSFFFFWRWVGRNNSR